jgi:hypothetical protein
MATTKRTTLSALAGMLLSLSLLSLVDVNKALAFGRSPHFSVPRVPLHMRLTGTLHPHGAEDDLKGLHVYPVSVYGQELFFQTEKAQTLTGSQHGTSVLARLFPPRLWFSGSEDLLSKLAAPENRGKRFVVTGYLYGGNNRFWVTELGEPEEMPE